MVNAQNNAAEFFSLPEKKTFLAALLSCLLTRIAFIRVGSNGLSLGLDRKWSLRAWPFRLGVYKIQLLKLPLYQQNEEKTLV